MSRNYSATIITHCRIQKERFQNIADYDAAIGLFELKPQLMTKDKRRMVPHPLPRNKEDGSLGYGAREVL